jgi:hypothetical protein
MKDVLSLFTFAIGALCFVAFLTVVKPDALSAVPGSSKPVHCSTEASPAHGCRLHFFPAVSAAWKIIGWRRKS